MKLIGLTKLALLYSGLHMFLTLKQGIIKGTQVSVIFSLHYKAEVSNAFLSQTQQ